jgi:uncharacterized Ntn-hydrolase superfamily protein
MRTPHRALASLLALASFVSVAALASPAHGASDTRAAAEGAAIPDAAVREGHPFFATFSICAIDPATGQSGVAVTTRVPFVGRAVPWARAGVGAVATQSWTIVEYGRQGLDLMEEGLTPAETLAQLLADDAGRELRQLGLIDMQGRTATHTGAENGAWAGSRQGDNYTVQANIMVGPQVVEAVADSFESTAASGMPLAERLILALEAGQATGGDKRWGRLQSAAIRVADPNHPGRGGDHLAVSIGVGEHPTPVAEMKRIYYLTEERLGYREFSEIRGTDVVELKRMLHALGYWRPQLEVLPEPPEFDIDRDLSRSDPAAFQQAIEEFGELAREFEEAWALYDAEAVAAVDTFRKAEGLDHPGNPPGLVDRALVDALRAAYQARD